MKSQPARTKYKKYHKIRLNHNPVFQKPIRKGCLMLKSTQAASIRANQIELIRQRIQRNTRRRGKLLIRVFPHNPRTAIPAETRMGGGKGAVDHWVSHVRPGRIIFELSKLPNNIMLDSIRKIQHKLGFKTVVSPASDYGV